MRLRLGGDEAQILMGGQEFAYEFVPFYLNLPKTFP